MFGQKESYQMVIDGTLTVKLSCVCGRTMELHTCKRTGGTERGLKSDEDYLWLRGYFQKYNKESEWGRWLQDTLGMEVMIV